MSGNSAIWAIQVAIKALLVADSTLMAMLVGGVHDDPPRSQPFPYLTLDVGPELPNDEYTKRGKSVEAKLNVWSQYAGYKQALDAAARIATILDDSEAILSVTGYTVNDVKHVRTEPIRFPDGETRLVEITFAIWVSLN